MALDLEEQEQIANLKSFWNRFGKYIIGVATVALFIYAAMSGWSWYQRSQSAEAAKLYETLLSTLSKNERDKTFLAADSTLFPVGSIEDLSRSRQELPKAYRQSGSIYVVGVRDFLANNSLHVSPVRGIEVGLEEAIDVDTPADLEAVRQVASNFDA